MEKHVLSENGVHVNFKSDYEMFALGCFNG